MAIPALSQESSGAESRVSAPPSFLRAEQWQALRDAVAADDRQRFEHLVAQIIQQAVRAHIARREANRPARPWLPEYV